MVWTMAFPDLFSKEDVQGYLRSTAESLGVEIDSDTLAAELDRRDPVAHLRTFFNIPSVGQLLAEGERSAGTSPSCADSYSQLVNICRCGSVYRECVSVWQFPWLAA